MPVAIINNETIPDSNVIVQKLEQILTDMVPTEDLQRFFDPEIAHWLQWVDTSLAVLLYPNFTRNFSESWEAFSYVMVSVHIEVFLSCNAHLCLDESLTLAIPQDVPHFNTLAKASNRVLGPVAMWAAQGKIKKKYNIDDERAALYGAVDHWVSAVGDKQFLTGDKPSMADCAVYACFRSISHLKTFAEVMAETKVEPWYKRMEAAIGESQLKNYR